MSRSTVTRVPRRVAVVVALSWVASVAMRAQSATATLPVLHDLKGVDDLRTVFDDAHDTLRVVMLLSPT